MESYDVLIKQELCGETPKERYENLVAMKKMLMRIAYPCRGTKDESMDIQDFANEIIETIGREKLEN